MLKRARVLVIALVSALCLTALAPRNSFALDIDVLGGANFDSPSVTVPSVPDLTTNSRFSASGLTGTAGVFVGFDLLPGFAFETGLQYLPRTYNVTSVLAADNYDVSLKYYMVPAILRFTALPIINFGVGPYYARGSSVITYAGTISGQPNTVQTSNFAQGATAVSDWGLVGSVQAKLPILPFFHLTADARYLYGMENVDATGIAGQSTKYRDVQFLFGAGLSL